MSARDELEYWCANDDTQSDERWEPRWIGTLMSLCVQEEHINEHQVQRECETIKNVSQETIDIG